MILRFIYFMTLCATLMSCKPTQDSVSKDLQQEININSCPDDGMCSFEILKHKTLEIKTDGIGAKYPQVQNGDKTVLKFEYKRASNPAIADDGYSEIIYAEIHPDTRSLSLNDEMLSQAKILFGRLCFCRGESGYFEAAEGSFEISEYKNKTSLQLDFDLNIPEVPQVIQQMTIVYFP